MGTDTARSFARNHWQCQAEGPAHTHTYYTVPQKSGAYETASTEKSSTGGGIIKYGKIKYDCAWMENASTEKNNYKSLDGKCKYGKMKYDWAGAKNVSTNSAGKVKHNNSPIIFRSGKQLSPFL